MSKRKNKRNLILIIAICICIVIILIALLNVKSRETDEVKNEKEMQRQKEEEQEELMEELKSVSEGERIKIYISQYFKFLEQKDYNSAYNLLYPEFKKNYFPTIDDYTKYISEQELPELFTIDYDDIYMQGSYYIATVRIGDMFTRTDTTKVTYTLIIQENGYNDFYISIKK